MSTPAGRRGARLALAALGLLAPAAFGGRIGESYDISFHAGPLEVLRTPFGELTLVGSPHLVTSVFFDVGVYLVVIGVMLELARSLGSGIDTHEAEDRAPAPHPSETSARPARRMPMPERVPEPRGRAVT